MMMVEMAKIEITTDKNNTRSRKKIILILPFTLQHPHRAWNVLESRIDLSVTLRYCPLAALAVSCILGAP